MNFRTRRILGLSPKPQKRAAVLGCGPAGLFAAHALFMNGWDVAILSKKRRSEMFGAQYLHQPIPDLGLSTRSVELKYRLLGSVEGYRAKVYGRRSGIAVSPETLPEVHQAWDIRDAYYQAWSRYNHMIVNVPMITPDFVRGLCDEDFDLIASSLPAPAICNEPDKHMFDSQDIWAVGDAPERGQFVPLKGKQDEVVLNGDPDSAWYRLATVFGYSTMEWPGGRKPPIEGIASVSKPISTDCDCFPSVRRIGRYGKWTKGVLSHEAYQEALSW